MAHISKIYSAANILKGVQNNFFPRFNFLKITQMLINDTTALRSL